MAWRFKQYNSKKITRLWIINQVLKLFAKNLQYYKSSSAFISFVILHYYMTPKSFTGKFAISMQCSTSLDRFFNVLRSIYIISLHTCRIIQNVSGMKAVSVMFFHYRQIPCKSSKCSKSWLLSVLVQQYIKPHLKHSILSCCTRSVI